MCFLKQYSGFCVDMLEKISKICNFTYSIRLVEDGLHGTQMKNGRWNGIVRELIDKKSDLAVAALTISFQREQVYDVNVCRLAQSLNFYFL